MVFKGTTSMPNARNASALRCELATVVKSSAKSASALMKIDGTAGPHPNHMIGFDHVKAAWAAACLACS